MTLAILPFLTHSDQAYVMLPFFAAIKLTHMTWHLTTIKQACLYVSVRGYSCLV